MSNPNSTGPSLADVDGALANNKLLTPTRRRDLRSAISRVAALVGDDPAHLPLDLAALAGRLAGINPVAAGLTPNITLCAGIQIFPGFYQTTFKGASNLTQCRKRRFNLKGVVFGQKARLRLREADARAGETHLATIAFNRSFSSSAHAFFFGRICQLAV
jgi:hypothetical protein